MLILLLEMLLVIVTTDESATPAVALVKCLTRNCTTCCVSLDFPDLKHKLHDHAEDYEKMHAPSTFTQHTSQLTRITDGQSATKLTAEVDPLAVLTEQLNQMDTKQADQDLKLTELDAKLTVRPIYQP